MDSAEKSGVYLIKVFIFRMLGHHECLIGSHLPLQLYFEKKSKRGDWVH